VLGAEPTLASAVLGRKALRHFPKQNFFCSAFTREAWYGLSGADRAQVLVSRLTKTVRLPGRVLVLARRAAFVVRGN